MCVCVCVCVCACVRACVRVCTCHVMQVCVVPTNVHSLLQYIFCSLFLSMSTCAGETRAIGRGEPGDFPPASSPTPFYKKAAAGRLPSGRQEEEDVPVSLGNGEERALVSAGGSLL